jgi:hypothetical protein
MSSTTPDARSDQLSPVEHYVQSAAFSADVVMLPSPQATLVQNNNGVVELYGPHSTVWQVSAPQLMLDVAPDWVKVLFGATSDFIDRVYSQAEHAFLLPFAQNASTTTWRALLEEGIDSVTITSEHRWFRRWMEAPALLDRQAERCALRYAGQSPTRILKQRKVSAEFVGNLPTATYQPHGHFADQSHYIRACRELTGYTPTQLRNLSESFYLGGQVFRKTVHPQRLQRKAKGEPTWR